jgi:hypothetical protein
VDPEYAFAVQDALTLPTTGSIFRYSEAAQRKLPPNHALCWGDTYWLVGHAEALNLEIAPASVEVSTADLRDPWIIALVTLPPRRLLTDEEAQAAELWLNRRILTPTDSFGFLDPLPHHFDDEGMPVFPLGTLVRIRCESSPTITDPLGTRVDVVTDSTEQACEFRVAQVGNWNIELSATAGGIIRVDKCPVLALPSFTLALQDESASFPSFAAERLLARASLSGEILELKVGQATLRPLVMVNDSPWPDEAAEVWKIVPVIGQPLRIDVQDLGSIGSVGALRVERRRNRYSDLEAHCTWLWAVSAPESTPRRELRIRLPSGTLPPSIRRLELRCWDRRFAAHIRFVEAELRKRGSHDL